MSWHGSRQACGNYACMSRIVEELSGKQKRKMREKFKLLTTPWKLFNGKNVVVVVNCWGSKRENRNLMIWEIHPRPTYLAKLVHVLNSLFSFISFSANGRRDGNGRVLKWKIFSSITYSNQNFVLHGEKQDYISLGLAQLKISSRKLKPMFNKKME